MMTAFYSEAKHAAPAVASTPATNEAGPMIIVGQSGVHSLLSF